MLTNPRADRVRSVRALSKRPVRERTGRFAVEGPQGVREAVRYAAPRVRDVYVTTEALTRYAADIVDPARAAGLSSTSSTTSTPRSAPVANRARGGSGRGPPAIPR